MKKSINFFFLLFSSFSVVHAQSETEPYKYPIVPGSVEWKALDTHADMLKVCQLPESYLKTSTTEALLETCLNYPLYSDAIFYDNHVNAWQSLKNGFNGFGELLSRKDLLPVLSKRMKQVNINQIDFYDDLTGKGRFVYGVWFLELLSGDDVVVQNIIKQKKEKEWIKDLLKIYEKKEVNKVHFGFLGEKGSAYLIGKIMYNYAYGDKKGRIADSNKALVSSERMLFFEKGIIEEPVVINEIISSAYDFLKNN